jgi:MFS family permease
MAWLIALFFVLVFSTWLTWAIISVKKGQFTENRQGYGSKSYKFDLSGFVLGSIACLLISSGSWFMVFLAPIFVGVVLLVVVIMSILVGSLIWKFAPETDQAKKIQLLIDKIKAS